MIVKIHEAKTQLSKLIAAVEAGEEVTIARGDKAVAKLVPANPPARRKPVFGALKGKVAVTDAFFEPLPDDELALWNGEGD